jgi:hypothetical protein
MARELGPEGIHVAHVRDRRAPSTRRSSAKLPERYELKEKGGILDPEAIARTTGSLHRQQRSAWTHELDLPPLTETW